MTRRRASPHPGPLPQGERGDSYVGHSPLASSARLLVLAVIAAGVTAPAAGMAPDPIDRLLAAVRAYVDDAVMASVAGLRAACGADAACAVARLDPRFAQRLTLERVRHPDTDTIRWAKTHVSVRVVRRLDDGAVHLALDGFGRKAAAEVEDALAAFPGERLRLVLDLRRNGGGDLARMLRVAALFAGGRAGALALVDTNGRRPLDIPSPSRTFKFARVTVVVGPRTASSAEVLAALLRRHAGARIVGTRTAGKDYVHRVVPLSHDWRLLVAAERIAVPGETLAGGVTPDRTVPAALARLLAVSPSR